MYSCIFRQNERIVLASTMRDRRSAWQSPADGGMPATNMHRVAPALRIASKAGSAAIASSVAPSDPSHRPLASAARSSAPYPGHGPGCLHRRPRCDRRECCIRGTQPFGVIRGLCPPHITRYGRWPRMLGPSRRRASADTCLQQLLRYAPLTSPSHICSRPPVPNRPHGHASCI